jgi:trimethylamine--corrinoid protein Co-methyltransferase
VRPKLDLLSQEQVEQVFEDAHRILNMVGVRVQSEEARTLLREAGAIININEDVVKIPDQVIESALKTTPSNFQLFNQQGSGVITYGGDQVHFDPGSSGVHVLDPDTLEHRPAVTADLMKIVQVTEMLSQYDAQSTAVVCNDVPTSIGDLYRLYLVLLLSEKPIITGSFSIHGLEIMLEMLALYAGGRKQMAEKPRAVFDVCPTPPLIWSEFAVLNLITLARAGLPAEMVSMPLAGAASPVTLLGSIAQHAAESLAGIVIHQAAQPGAPIVWGGAPAIFDMRKGSTPFGAIETAMINAACAQVGKTLNLPTHGYLGASDSKVVDAQSGMESSTTALVGALAGVNMISGAGMLDFLACQSPEKLVLDAESIASIKRLLNGISDGDIDLVPAFYKDFEFKGDFLKNRYTRDLFKNEQYLPSEVIDRDSLRGWQAVGKQDAWQRTKVRTRKLLDAYRAPGIDQKLINELVYLVSSQAKTAGMEFLPEVPLAR